MTAPGSAIDLQREVGATMRDYLRQLRLALPGGVDGDGANITVSDGQACLAITLTTLPPRVIALARIPRLKVSLRGTAGDMAAQAALLARIDRALQRGGG